MNVKELVERLKEANIPNDSYSILENKKDESICLVNETGTWEVFYSERGLRTELARFTGEDEACDHFFRRIIKWFPGYHIS